MRSYIKKEPFAVDFCFAVSAYFWDFLVFRTSVDLCY